ncbi:HNH endonuclease [Komarekiella sp. 'clone 1']|uniref:HNH endonuclease n=1 Tax=Komarekiella delphini-convector SJRDD-AB1 TaxID=2593771 RepID=A0AA40VQ06_9NOST|nr:RNA-guided endonuclease IscB [Komarekiella delphini-convector]MBD6615317.1 HNH endonuclease [Komarekiella delphini-convector SJRDD-AB1]
MSNYVLVIDTNKQPCNPIHPGTARKLLNDGKAAVFRRYPFTIILKTISTKPIKPIQIKLDPGSKTSGIALIQSNKVIFGAELTHRGATIKASLESRKSLRRARRSRHTRYRQARFLNRTRCQQWLAPSLQHRVETTITWVNRLIKFVPVTCISQELVRFDLQQLENPEISGIEYQQGELLGYEVREYLLNKWDRRCSYCDVENVALQVEHIHALSRGGTNRISNLCLACDRCNKKKGTQDIEKFLAKKPDVLKRILSQTKRPLKDASAVNSTRWALFNRLKETGLPISTGSGGLTKFNRTRLGLPKTHWLDAACVGKVETLEILTNKPLLIKATGHGTRKMCGTNKFGFPIRHRERKKFHFGLQTGDIVKALVITGKYIGNYVGRIAVRAKGSFSVTHKLGKFDTSHKFCKTIHKNDGYEYSI